MAPSLQRHKLRVPLINFDAVNVYDSNRTEVTHWRERDSRDYTVSESLDKTNSRENRSFIKNSEPGLHPSRIRINPFLKAIAHSNGNSLGWLPSLLWFFFRGAQNEHFRILTASVTNVTDFRCILYNANGVTFCLTRLFVVNKRFDAMPLRCNDIHMFA